jgi:DNA-binding Xre family transcriptional regulator
MSSENGTERIAMEVSYKKLWKLLIDKDMKKKDLQAQAGISWTSVTKLSKGENVSMEVLMKVCKALECNIGDIMDLIPEEGDTNGELKEE